MQIFMLGLITCVVAMTIGHWVAKHLRLPWMFTVLLLGLALSSLGLFQETLASEGFQLLSRLAMLLFLFSIGLDLDLSEVRRLGRRIIVGDILLVLIEGTVLAAFFYFVFPQYVAYSPVVALVAGIAFGTIGEVVLLAILKEFRLEQTRFGQLALGIAVFDDVFEILVLAAAIGLPAFFGQGSVQAALLSAARLIGTLVGLILLTLAVARLKPLAHRLLPRLNGNAYVVPFIIFSVLYLFLYLGSRSFDNLGVVAAIFAGVAIKQLLPPPLLQQYKRPLYFVANIFLGPFFFLGLGGKMSLSALAHYPLAILAVVAISLVIRVSLSYLLFRDLLGRRQSVVLGVGLCGKMSTSVITENLLLTSGLLGAPLYSIIMAAFIVLKPVVAAVFSRGLAHVEREPVTLSPEG